MCHGVAFSHDELDDAVDFVNMYKPALQDYLQGRSTVTDFLQEFVRTNTYGNQFVFTHDEVTRRALRYCTTHEGRCPSLNVNVVDGCNIACAHCSAAAPIVPHVVPASVKQLVAAFKRVATLCGEDHAPLELNMFGGEPLLHPQLSAIIMAARMTFPHAKLAVATNGLMLADAQQLIKIMRKCQCGVTVSVYGPGVYFNNMPYYATAHAPADCRLCFANPNNVTVVKASTGYDVFCCEASLWANGDIGFCYASRCMHTFSQVRGNPKLVDGVDFVNVHRLTSFDELDKFINHATCSMSRYCRPAQAVPWSISTGQDSEWFE